MKILKALAAPCLVLMLAWTLFHDRLKTEASFKDTPNLDAATVGKTYVPILASTYADGWIAAAQALDDGKSVAEAQKILQDTWKESRTKAFRSQVAPAMAAILAEGTEPKTSAQRAQVVQFWKDFAAGLKGEVGR